MTKSKATDLSSASICMDLKKRAKALADLKAGRNIPEAVSVFYHTENKDEIDVLAKIYTTDPAIISGRKTAKAAKKSCEGERLLHPSLGRLTHDGGDFVGKHKTPLYPRRAIEVRLKSELSRDATVTHVWSAFCKREHKLKSELQKAIATHYEEFRCRAAFLKLKPLKHPSGIWRTLGRPSILIGRGRKWVEICVAWSPKWETEHGLCVYLTPKATIREIE